MSRSSNMRSGDGFDTSAARLARRPFHPRVCFKPLKLACSRGHVRSSVHRVIPNIPRADGFGFSAYSVDGKVLTGLSCGNTDQLRIISEPVIGVHGVSFRDMVSKFSPSMSSSRASWSGRCCGRPFRAPSVRAARRRPCSSTAPRIFLPHVSNLWGATPSSAHTT